MNLEDLILDLTENELELKLKYHKTCSTLFKLKEDNIENKNPDEHYFEIQPDDFNKAFCFTVARTIKNKRKKVKDDLQNEEKIESEFLGVLTEVVLCRKFDVDFDDNIEVRSGGFDFVLFNKKIDSKCSLLRNNFSDSVVVSEKKKLGQADYYFFARHIIFEGKKYINLYGFLEEKDVFKDINFNRPYSGYWIKKNKLKKFDPYIIDKYKEL